MSHKQYKGEDVFHRFIRLSDGDLVINAWRCLTDGIFEYVPLMGNFNLCRYSNIVFFQVGIF